MKIAVASQDAVEVAGHLGHCTSFLVFEIEDGVVQSRTVRQLAEGGDCQCHGMSLFSVVDDCEHVICGGMGRGLFNKLQAKGITPVITDEANAEQAVARFLQGTLAGAVAATCGCSR